jgi:hypothetical protein
MVPVNWDETTRLASELPLLPCCCADLSQLSQALLFIKWGQLFSCCMAWALLQSCNVSYSSRSVFYQKVFCFLRYLIFLLVVLCYVLEQSISQWNWIMTLGIQVIVLVLSVKINDEHSDSAILCSIDACDWKFYVRPFF